MIPRGILYALLDVAIFRFILLVEGSTVQMYFLNANIILPAYTYFFVLFNDLRHSY